MHPACLHALAVALLAHAVVSRATSLELADFPVTDRLVPDDPLPPRPWRLESGATVLTDVVYARREGSRPLTLDLYGLGHGGRPRPLVVFVHGGGWRTGSPRAAASFTNFPEVLAAVAARGFIVAAIEYRLRDEARFPGPLLDVRDAVRFLRSRAGDFEIDPGRVALWGVSAGAHLAALAATTCDGTPGFDSAAVPTATQPSDCVRGFVGWFGVYDLVDAGASASAALNLLDCPKGTCTTEALQAASPVTYANHGDPPALLLHGTVDRLVADSQSREFARRLHEAGTPVELRLVEGAGHGWIGTDTAATVRYSRQALTATVEFLEHVLQTDVPRD